MLCDTDPPRASEALEHFSFYLRGNLDSLVSMQLVPLERELVHALCGGALLIESEKGVETTAKIILPQNAAI